MGWREWGEQRNLDKDARIIEALDLSEETTSPRSATHGQRKGARLALVAAVAGRLCVGRVDEQPVNPNATHRFVFRPRHRRAPSFPRQC